MSVFDTITAISTPPGKGGVALIRISGDMTNEIVSRCVAPRTGKDAALCPPRHAVWVDILENGRVIDDGILVRFPAPHSYTGEDMAEISCHGGILLTERVLTAVLCAGARMAGPGEFTRRAFVNGKLSLTKAEAIGQLLEAQTNAQLDLAAPAACEALRKKTDVMADELLSLLASLYADIDYPEEELGTLSREQMTAQVLQLSTDAKELKESYHMGHAVAEGLSCVICGRPNVGKSSLYNLLCGEDAAIVTDEAGTTRDVLEKTIAAGRVTLRLCDTAGLRDAESRAEKEGVERSRLRIRNAELVLAVFDASQPLSKEDNDLLQTLKTIPGQVICILNKWDLSHQCVPCDLEKAGFPVVTMSAVSGDKTSLVSLIEKIYLSEQLVIGQSPIVTSARQSASLAAAAASLDHALSALNHGLTYDIVASELETALRSLKEINGQEVSEQIVSEIFSRFCVGK